MNAKFILILPVCAVLIIGGFFLLTPEVTNCGGNSAALSHVRSYTNFVCVIAQDYPRDGFVISSGSVPADERDLLTSITGDHWIGGARYLVSTAPVSGDKSSPRRIIIVCDTPFTNVPQHRFWHAPPTHAAGYSDGTTGLISPGEFAALDKSSFVYLDQLFPPSKK